VCATCFSVLFSWKLLRSFFYSQSLEINNDVPVIHTPQFTVLENWDQIWIPCPLLFISKKKKKKLFFFFFFLPMIFFYFWNCYPVLILHIFNFFLTYRLWLILDWFYIFLFFFSCLYLYFFNFLSPLILYFKFIYWNFILLLMFLVPKSSFLFV